MPNLNTTLHLEMLKRSNGRQGLLNESSRRSIERSLIVASMALNGETPSSLNP